jgi:CBS domain-containing protein
MKAVDVMTRDVLTCSRGEMLETAAQIMWERDCGIVPVVDESGRAVGVVTDRDVCLAALSSLRPLSEIPVVAAISKELVSATEEASVDDVAKLMREHQIRRVPIVDEAGRPVGIVSLADLVRHVDGAYGIRPDTVALTLAAISRPGEEGAARRFPIAPAYHVRSLDGGWAVFDRAGRCLTEPLRTQGDAVVHAKELARDVGSAQVIVHHADGSVASEFFHLRDERSSLERDDTLPTIAASRPAHVERPGR